MSRIDTKKNADFRLGEWLIMPDRNCLSNGSETVSIENKCMQLLVLLASRPGEVVSSEDIIASVWNDRPMGDSPIYKHIATLRSALGDDSKSPKYIETIPRKGYRLIPTQLQLEETSGNSHARDGATSIAAVVAALLVIALIAGINMFAFTDLKTDDPAQATSSEHSIAVLSFENLSANPANDALGRGIADELLNRLAEMSGVQVIARRSSLFEAVPQASIVKIAEQLNVDYLMFGSINEGEQGFRVNARIVDQAGQLVWAEGFDRSAQNLVALQDDIAGAVARSLALEVGAEPGRTHARTDNFDAYSAYLLGLELKNRRSIGWGPKAITAFNDAIRLDAGFAAPYAGLATTLMLTGAQSEEVDRLINEALRLDPYLAEAHEAAGLAHQQGGGPDDYLAAEAAFREALRLNPSLVDTHNWLSITLQVLGEGEESLQLLQQALRLDPLNSILHLNLGRRYHSNGQLDLARAQMQKVLFWPDTRSYAWLWIAEVERDAGRLDNALEWLRQGYQQGVFRAEETHWIAGSLATLYARLGIRDRAMEWWQTYDVPGRFSWRLAEESAFSSALQEPERLADAVEFYVASGGRMTLMPRSHIAKFAIRSGDYRRGIELLAPIFEKGWVPRNEPGGSDEMYTTSHYLAVALQRSNQAQQADDLLQRTLELQLAGRDGRSRMLGRRLAEEAVTYLLLGDSATAMARFREAVEAGWRYWYDIGGNPCWDGLREHPEFEALLSQVMDDIALQRERVRAVENVQPFTPDI